MRLLTLFILLLATVAIHSEEDADEGREVDEIEETAEEAQEEEDEEWMNDGILSLTTDDFESYISENQFVLVEFYAPWCPHCKTLASDYVKVAEELEATGSRIKVVKVDATKNSDLSEQYNVRGYPTLKFFRNKTPIDYLGVKQATVIVDWLNKKIGLAAEEIENVEGANEFIASEAITIVGFFDDRVSDEAQAFLEAADTVDDYPFGITSNADVYAKYGAESGSIILFKQSGNEKSVFDGEAKKEPILHFVAIESAPSVIEFNRTSHMIFSVVKSHLIIFISKEAGHMEQYVKPAEELGKHFKGKVVFVAIDTDVEDYARILSYFKVEKEEVPTMRLIATVGDASSKYTPKNSELSLENIKSFVQDGLDGKLKKDLLGQEVPDDWDATPVKKLVSNNFDDVVLNKDKDVLVLFYALWSEESNPVVTIWDELGEKYKDSDTVVLAKIDASANELDVQHSKITLYPTIKLYKKGDNEVTAYGGKKTLDAFVKFIESGGDEVEFDEEKKSESSGEQEESPESKDEL